MGRSLLLLLMMMLWMFVVVVVVTADRFVVKKRTEVVKWFVDRSVGT